MDTPPIDTPPQDTPPQADLQLPILDDPSLTRRRFLRGAALAGGGLIVAGVAACAPAVGAPGWTFGPGVPSTAPVPSGTPAASAAASLAASADPGMSMAPSASPSAAPSGATGPIPAGWTLHDVAARDVIRRYLGDLVPTLKGIYGEAAYLKIVDILGPETDYPSLHQKPAFMQVPQLYLNDALKPLTPTLDGDVKVFKLTIDDIEQQVDELLPPVAGFGFNAQIPGPTIRVNLGDKVRVEFTNNLKETTSIHFHGVDFDDFFMDGVAFVNQKPFVPGATFSYEFTATTAGSLMYHSHHNATDQVGRGLLGAFLVDPKPDPVKYDREYVWIANDALGGFTINGHGFPAVVPVLAAVGENVRIRFMNQGIMMHPWHLHGQPMHVIERDGHPLGSAEFDCDTLGVNPGERYDVIVKAKTPGVWAFHCHILPHAEGTNGMYGMVSTLIVLPKASDVDAVVAALLA